MTRTIPEAIRRAVIARDGMWCQNCRIRVVFRPYGVKYVPNEIHLDHIVQWAEGGESTVDNLRVYCGACNLSRPQVGNTRPPEPPKVCPRCDSIHMTGGAPRCGTCKRYRSAADFPTRCTTRCYECARRKR